MSRSAKIHLGDASRGVLFCGVKPKALPKNWTWVPERATCARCLAAYKKDCLERMSR